MCEQKESRGEWKGGKQGCKETKRRKRQEIDTSKR
jgi:hypothetical protein